MRKDMVNSIFEVSNNIAIGVKVTSAVLLAIEVAVTLECIVAVDRYQQLNAVIVGLRHESIESIEDSVVICLRQVPFKAWERVDRCAFGSSRLACPQSQYVSF